MKLKPLPVVGGSFADITRPFDSQDTCNWIPEASPSDGALAKAILRGAPGLLLWQTLGDGPIRGSRDIEGISYHVSGTSLYKVTAAGVATVLGTVPGHLPVGMSHNQITNGHQLGIFNGPEGFIYSTVTGVFAKITDPDFPGSAVIDYINSFFVGVRPDGSEWFTSDLAAGDSYLSTDTYEAESEPDRIVGIIVNNGEVLALGANSIDVFWNAGVTDATFQSKNIPIGLGCAGKFTACSLDNTVFMLCSDGTIRRLNGYTLVRISTHPVEQSIARLNWANARAFVYSDRGHLIYYITFPDGPTWGYDVASGQWHRRQSYGFRNWRIATLIFTNGRWLAGDAVNGKLYWLDWDIFDEAGEPLIAIRRLAYIHDNQNSVSMARLELVMNTGEQPSQYVLDENGVVIDDESDFFIETE